MRQKTREEKQMGQENKQLCSEATVPEMDTAQFRILKSQDQSRCTNASNIPSAWEICCVGIAANSPHMDLRALSITYFLLELY